MVEQLAHIRRSALHRQLGVERAPARSRAVNPHHSQPVVQGIPVQQPRLQPGAGEAVQVEDGAGRSAGAAAPAAGAAAGTEEAVGELPAVSQCHLVHRGRQGGHGCWKRGGGAAAEELHQEGLQAAWTPGAEGSWVGVEGQDSDGPMQTGRRVRNARVEASLGTASLARAWRGTAGGTTRRRRVCYILTPSPLPSALGAQRIRPEFPNHHS